MLAAQSSRESHQGGVAACAGLDVELCPALAQLEEVVVVVEAGLRGRGSRPGLRTQAEPEVSPVVRSHIHRHLHHLPGAVGPHDHPPAELPSRLPRPRLRLVPGVSTLAAPPPVLVPLPPEAATVRLVVVVICRSFESKSPRGGSRRRLNQPAMG